MFSSSAENLYKTKDILFKINFVVFHTIKFTEEK